MGTCTLPCSRTFTYVNPGRMNSSQNQLLVGKRSGQIFWTYLYFSLDQIPENRFLKKAKLVLFPLPGFYNQEHNMDYLVAPTTSYFTPRTAYRENDYLTNEAILFHLTGPNDCLELDISTIVTNWYSQNYENHGIVIMSVGMEGVQQFYGSNHGVHYPQCVVEYRQMDGIIPVLQESSVLLPTSIKIL